MKNKCWYEDKTPEDMESFDKDEIIYNLTEDIQCLNEDIQCLKEISLNYKIEEVLNILTKIKESLGGEKCQVLFITNHCGGFSIRVHWLDGNNYSFSQCYTNYEIIDKNRGSLIVDQFIELAIHKKSQI